MMSDNPDDPATDEENQEELLQVAELEGSINLSDPKSQRRQRKRVDNEAEQASKFWRDLFSTQVGRREMWKLLRMAQPDGTPFSPVFPCGPTGFPDPNAAWFRAGQYAIAQGYYQHWLQIDRDGTLLMLDEYDPRFAKPRKRSRQSP
jgi:hypothetical protein